MSTMINVEHVSMRFRLESDRVSSLKEFIIRKLKGQLHYREFEALSDVSFTVDRGEVLGLIGVNGAGKSTLLKVISGILAPTEGKAVTHGSIVPMLELGSGFDPELTGSENIYLNGAILGYEEDFLKRRYPEIVAFSGLEKDFLDMPLRNYSSGMLSRLAFSIATVVEPEILIVDEILSVGDSDFQKKSLARMHELMSGGTTVLFVSHDIDTVERLCDRCLWLDHGHMTAIGPAKDICDQYRALHG